MTHNKRLTDKLMDIARWYSMPADHFNVVKEAVKILESAPSTSCSENLNRCGDAISRQAVLEQINCWIGSGEYRYTNATDYLTKRITSLLSVSAEKTDAYKQGWHDAITTALKETHSVHTEEGHFRVVQEETLIGVGMAYEQVSVEKMQRRNWWNGMAN